MARQLAMKGAAIPAVIHVLKEIEAQNDVFFYIFLKRFQNSGIFKALFAGF